LKGATAASEKRTNNASDLARRVIRVDKVFILLPSAVTLFFLSPGVYAWVAVPLLGRSPVLRGFEKASAIFIRCKKPDEPGLDNIIIGR